MSLNKAYISSTQVASSTPFDNTTNNGYIGTDVQQALQELRSYTIYGSNTTATTLNGTLTLTSPIAGGGYGITGDTLQFITGTATGYSVVMPDATTLTDGAHYKIDNLSTQPITIKDGSGATLFILAPSSIGELTLQLNTTTAGAWVWWQTLLNTADGIVSYNITSSTTFTTSSTTDVVITGFTITPQQGTYAVWVNGQWTPQAGPGNVESVTIYNNGVAVTDSIRGISPVQSTDPSLMCTQTITQVTGSQAIDVRIKSSGGQSLQVTNRSLLLIRLGV